MGKEGKIENGRTPDAGSRLGGKSTYAMGDGAAAREKTEEGKRERKLEEGGAQGGSNGEKEGRGGGTA